MNNLTFVMMPRSIECSLSFKLLDYRGKNTGPHPYQFQMNELDDFGASTEGKYLGRFNPNEWRMRAVYSSPSILISLVDH